MSHYKINATKKLDKTYTAKLTPILKKIQKGELPSRSQRSLVLIIKNEIQGVPFQCVPETIKYIARIDEGYGILKNERYKQELETKYEKTKTKFLKSNNEIEKKLLEKKMRNIEEDLILYGH